MTLLVDAGPIVAAADRRDPAREAVQRILRSEGKPIVVTAPVTAEADYLLGVRLGVDARKGFLDDLAARRFTVECLQDDEYATVAGLERTYSDLGAGLADLSIVVVAGRLRTRRILTFDERHFRAIRPLQGGAFRVLPADE